MAWWWSGLEFGPLRATFPLQTSLTHVAPAWRILVAENSFIELSPTLFYTSSFTVSFISPGGVLLLQTLMPDPL